MPFLTNLYSQEELMIQFGMGKLVGIRNDIEGATPRCFGEVQDASIEASFTEKDLKGRKQFAIDVARSGGKITGKAKSATIRGGIFSDIFFGVDATTGAILLAENEAGTIPSSTAYTITVANSTKFRTDLGVTDLTGNPYKLVTTTPTTGQYEVSTAGVYTFASADAGKHVLINYLYTSTSGHTISVTNQVMGVAPTFQMVLSNTYRDATLTVILNRCTSTKLSMPFKSEDHLVTEFDFSAMADESGGIGIWSLSE
jgi:hypothetical protein